MPDEAPQQPEQTNVQVMIDDRDVKSIYSNGYRIFQTHEEVIIDLGFNMVNPNPQQQQAQMVFKVTDRVIMTYTNVKRLTQSLQQLIKRYEQQFGEIPLPQTQMPRKG